MPWTSALACISIGISNARHFDYLYFVFVILHLNNDEWITILYSYEHECGQSGRRKDAKTLITSWRNSSYLFIPRIYFDSINANVRSHVKCFYSNKWMRETGWIWVRVCIHYKLWNLINDIRQWYGDGNVRKSGRADEEKGWRWAKTWLLWMNCHFSIVFQMFAYECVHIMAKQTASQFTIFFDEQSVCAQLTLSSSHKHTHTRTALLGWNRSSFRENWHILP